MTDRFENLKAACGGSISIEALTRFQIAMREYEVFMAGMSEMMAPLDPCRHSWHFDKHNIEVCVGCGVERGE